jgi:hypothetical protein
MIQEFFTKEKERISIEHYRYVAQELDSWTDVLHVLLCGASNNYNQDAYELAIGVLAEIDNCQLFEDCIPHLKSPELIEIFIYGVSCAYRIIEHKRLSIILSFQEINNRLVGCAIVDSIEQFEKISNKKRLRILNQMVKNSTDDYFIKYALEVIGPLI